MSNLAVACRMILWGVCSVLVSAGHLVAQDNVGEDDVTAIHRAFQYPEYKSTYASVQLFSISDIGRVTLPIKRPITNVLSRPAEYEPEFELTGSPMLKVRSSGVTIDMNGYYMRKIVRAIPGEYLPFVTAIEVGYSPAELAADATLTQIENVVIKNGGLIDFEMGIVVHAGVKNVIIENVYVAGCPLGILFLGQSTSQIASCDLRNVRVTGNFRDDYLILQWAKVKIEQNNVASIDSANGGTGIIKGKVGSSAAGWGYGTSYPCLQLQHNPVTNLNDAYTYHAIYMNEVINMNCKDVLVKCTGYQSDAHSMVQPGQTVGLITNPLTSSISINGPTVVGSSTPTITKGFTIQNSSTISLQNIDIHQLVSALAVYGIFLDSSSHVEVKNSVCSELDAHHITASTPQAILDANVAVDTSMPDPNTVATILSLYTTLDSFISALPASVSPALNAAIVVCRDAIVQHNARIVAGVDISGLLYHVEQIISSAECIIQVYNNLVLFALPIAADDNLAFLQASSIVQAGYSLFKQAYKSWYLSGRVCFGLYASNIGVLEVSGSHMHRNRAQHLVAGIFTNNVSNVQFLDIDASYNTSDDQGDSAALPVPIAPHATSSGIVLKNITAILLDRIIASNNISTGRSIGLYGYSVEPLKSKNIIANSNIATLNALPVGWVAGSCMFNANSHEYNSLHAHGNTAKRLAAGCWFSPGSCIKAIDMHTSNNASNTDEVVGTCVENCSSLQFERVNSNSNHGELLSYGFKLDGCSALDVLGMIADDNSVNTANSLATDCFGIWLNSPKSCLFKDVSGSYNQGRTLGIGFWAKQAKTIHMTDSSFCANTATDYATGEQDRCNDGADASKFLPKDYLSGALGMYIRESKDIEMARIDACKNNAHRAAGIFTLQSYDVRIKESNTSFQSATGNYFITNPFAGISFCTFPIPESQYSTLFGSPVVVDPLNPPNVIPADQLNLLSAICVFFNSMATIATDDGLKNLLLSDITDCADLYSKQKSIVLSWLLIQAALAKYRLFGTAVGLHVHDSDGFWVTDHSANGNQSRKDNAIGIACTGTNSNHHFDADRAINNDGWTDSALDAIAPGKYDLAAVKDFYTALYATSGDILANDFDFGADTTHLYPKAANFMTYTGKLFKKFQYFQITLNCNCSPLSPMPQPIWFTSPVGGIGAGIILGDCCQQVEVRNMDCSNNKGYSGASFGILQDVCSNATIENCRLYQNYANLLGWCYGIADITTISSSLMMRNFLFGNRLEGYLNSNYFVPYNPADPYGLSFPVRSGFNGDFTTLIDVGAYDNVEMRFTRSALAHCSLPDDVGARIDPVNPSCWEVYGFLENSGVVVSTPLDTCHTNLNILAPATSYFIDSFTEIIIDTVLAYPAGSIAITAGSAAGVQVGLLEIIATALATVIDTNRTLCQQELATLFCQQLYTILSSDSILLAHQEASSLLKPKHRAHKPGLPFQDAERAAYESLLRSGFESVRAATIAVLIEHMLEKDYKAGGNRALSAVRGLLSWYELYDTYQKMHQNADEQKAQEFLNRFAVADDEDALVQASVRRFVAQRLSIGVSEERILEYLQDPVEPYGAIIAELLSKVETFDETVKMKACNFLETFIFVYGDQENYHNHYGLMSKYQWYDVASYLAVDESKTMDIYILTMMSCVGFIKSMNFDLKKWAGLTTFLKNVQTIYDDYQLKIVSSVAQKDALLIGMWLAYLIHEFESVDQRVQQEELSQVFSDCMYHIQQP